MLRPRLLATLLVSALALNATPEIVRVWGDYVPASNFDRISEYFGAPESHPGRAIARTRPDARSGYYFLVRLSKADSMPAGSRWRLELLRKGERQPAVHEFPATASASVNQLGLTGEDWKDSREVPIAWKISLLGPDGTTVLSRQSFLWD